MATGSKTPLYAQRTPGGVLTITDQNFTTGDIFFVGSTNAEDAGDGTNPDAPFATIDFAVGKCTASQGDIIYVMPGHAEAITAATSLVMDVAGVSVIGLGHGALRPRLSFTTAATATISVTAANCRMKNLWLYSNFTNGITVGITVGAEADGLILEDIVMEEALNTQEFLTGISVTAAAHDVTIDGLQFHGIVGGTDVSAIVFAGASDRHVVRNSWFHGDWSGPVIDSTGAASVGILYADNRYYQDDAAAGLGIATSDTSTGLMWHCGGLNKKEGVEGHTGNVMAYVQCLCTNVVNKQGFLLPVADS